MNKQQSEHYQAVSDYYFFHLSERAHRRAEKIDVVAIAVLTAKLTKRYLRLEEKNVSNDS